MNNIFITNIGDLLDIQRVSYYKFLTEGLNSVLEPLSKKEFSLTKPLTKLVKKKEKKKKNRKIFRL